MRDDVQTYCMNQQQASRLLQSLRQSDPELSAHLQVRSWLRLG